MKNGRPPCPGRAARAAQARHQPDHGCVGGRDVHRGGGRFGRDVVVRGSVRVLGPIFIPIDVLGRSCLLPEIVPIIGARHESVQPAKPLLAEVVLFLLVEILQRLDRSEQHVRIVLEHPGDVGSAAVRAQEADEIPARRRGGGVRCRDGRPGARLLRTGPGGRAAEFGPTRGLRQTGGGTGSNALAGGVRMGGGVWVIYKKADYHTAVKEAHAGQKMSAKVKKFDLRGERQGHGGRAQRT